MKNIFTTAIIFIVLASSCSAQKQTIGVMFYNVENLMDTINNPTTFDDEFIPQSDKQWNTEKYTTKLDHISNVIQAVSYELPVLIGLCEVENKLVLNDLITNKKLSEGNYGIFHFDSPDKRGIDVAMLYRKDFFHPINSIPIPVQLSENNGGTTRDILYVTGELIQGEKKEVIHCFINHWPSRTEGEEVTAIRRAIAAETLKKQIDSLNKLYVDPHIIIMGDFNDTPFDKSIMGILKANGMDEESVNEGLINLSYEKQKNNEGTYNYQGNWQALDQIIISEELINHSATLFIKDNSFRIIKNDWMMYINNQYGPTPSKTYSGKKYYAGYSDHLPVYVEIIFN